MSTTTLDWPGAAQPPAQTPHRLQCMEIWGGNRSMEGAVAVPGIDAWIYSRPVGDNGAGGDIHYVSTCGGGKIARFIVADVSGHGDAVGALAAQLRKLMRRYMDTLDQTRFLHALNRAFSALASDGKFATAVLATYFAPTDHLITCNAGHPAPLWYRAAERNWRLLEHTDECCVAAAMNLPLGIVEPTQYSQFAVPLARGDLVVIYTDALPEARSPAGDALGMNGLLDLVRGLDPHEPEHVLPRLVEAVACYRGGAPAEDDLTIAVLHHNAANPPRQSLGEMMRVVGKMLHLVKV
jgi:phosphoserine phosphatase RsbU/P